MKPRSQSVLRLALLAGALALGALPAAAQRQRPSSGQQQPPGPWVPISVGVRVGYDAKANGEVVGGQVRIPVLPSGIVELMPTADVTFLNRTKDYQLNVEAVFVPGRRSGGLYLGGGFGRRSLALTPGNRQTVDTRSVVLGVRASGLAESLGFQIELRWIFIPESEIGFNPQPLTVGINLPLWGRGRSPRPAGR